METNQRTKKQGKIIAAVMAAFVLLAVILLYCNKDTMMAGKTAQSEKTLTFLCENQEPVTFTLAEIKKLPSESFDAVIRSSGAKPQQVVYEGVPLKEFINAANIDLTDKKQLVFTGADAYVSTVSTEELKEENIYIVYAMNGEEMKGKEQGGFGPYQLVIQDDVFSQRWCKYLAEVKIQ